MVSTRTKYIGTATTLFIVSILSWMLINGFKIEASGDMVCSGIPTYDNTFKSNVSDCQIFFNVTSTNATYYLRNRNGVELGFSQDVQDYQCYIKDGRYKSGYRPLDKYGNFTYKKGIKYEFMCYIFKDMEQTVKWSLTAADKSVDPILFGINITAIRRCTDSQDVVSKENIVTCIINSTYIHINNQTGINETKIWSYTRDCIDGTYDDLINKTTCTIIGFRDNTRNRNINCEKFGYACNPNSLVGQFIIADSIYDGNGNGRCESGESCCAYHIPTGKISCRNDIKREVEIE